MIDGPGRKKPPRSRGSSTPTFGPLREGRGEGRVEGRVDGWAVPPTSAEGRSAAVPPASEPLRPKGRDVARRTLEKLGQKMSSRPAPEVPVEQRAGRTARLRLGDALVGRCYAAIDVGSSSAKMLIQRVGADGRLRTVVDRKIGAALGKGVVNGAAIPLENQARALDALVAFLAEAAGHGVSAGDIPLITTAVVRNATNGDALLGKIRGLGLSRARILSGEEEAAVGFAGALAMIGGAPGRYATLDLGGGSFQLAIGSERGVEDGGSVQVGSNLILDTMIAPRAAPDGAGDPAVFDDIDRRLEALAPLPLDPAVLRGRTLVATGGVSKFLRAHFGEDVISARKIDALRRQVLSLPHADRVPLVQGTKDEATRKALGVDTPQGALDYGKKLPASASLLLHILAGLGVDEVRVSETDARHALVASVASVAGVTDARDDAPATRPTTHGTGR